MKFSKAQKDFFERFAIYANQKFKGEQVALADRIGCDQSSISRWLNKEGAPPDYVCTLLLEKLKADSFKLLVGHRIGRLREEIFQISLREFAWTLRLENISQLENIEKGEAELPHHGIEMLMRDYLVRPDYLDDGGELIFGKVTHDRENIAAHLKKGFKLYIVTPPVGHPDRSWLRCKFILHHEREYLPQCFVTSGGGSFKSTGGGQQVIEEASLALKANMMPMPAVLMADKKAWQELHEARFYRKQISFGLGCVDVPCQEKLETIFNSVGENVDWASRFLEENYKSLKTKKSEGSHSN